MQAKAGIIGLTKTVAKEWGAFNIRCNGLAYSLIATRLIAEKGGGASMQVTGQGLPAAQANRQQSLRASCINSASSCQGRFHVKKLDVVKPNKPLE